MLLSVGMYIAIVIIVWVFVFFGLPRVADGKFTEGFVPNRRKGRNSSAMARISNFANMRRKSNDSNTERMYQKNLERLVREQANNQI